MSSRLTSWKFWIFTRSVHTGKKSKLRKEFQKELKSDPTLDEKIETLSNSLLNDLPGTTGEAISRAKEVQRKRLKAAIVFRKNFSPDEWSAETISKNFPISDSGASKFLSKSQKKPNRVLRSLESVIRHDTACIGRWINIISVIVELQMEMGYIRPTLSTVLNALSHKLPRDLRWVGLHNFLDLLSFANGNSSLPLPPETSLDVYQRKLSQHSPGPFQRIAENIQKPILPDNNDLTVSSVTDAHSDVARLISGHSQSVLEEAISNFQFTFNSPSVTALGCLPPIATFSHQFKSLCDFSFSRSVNETETPERPEFKACYQLVLHLRIHSEEKPFTCSRCQQRFLSSENLRRHQRHHLGVKPYTCPECQKSFFRTSERSNCMRLHRLQRKLLSSGEGTKNVNGAAPAPLSAIAFEQKPTVTAEFVCPVCTIPRAYRDGGSLRKHLRSHHPDYKRPSIINLPKQPVDKRKKAGKQPSPTAVGESDTSLQSSCPSSHPPVVSEVSSSPSGSRHLTQGPTSWIAVQDGTLTQPVNGIFLLQENGLICEAAEYQIPATDFDTGISTSMDLVDNPVSHATAQQQELHREMQTESFAADITGGFGPRDAHLSEVICTTGDDFSQQSVWMLQDSPRLLRVFEENGTLCTPALPVDLCTSALCLTIDDTSHPHPYESEPFATLPRSEDETILGESVAHLKSADFQTTSRSTPTNEPSLMRLRNNAPPFATTSEEETPLDLTEMPSEGVFSHPPPSDDFFPFHVDEVIDLSAASTSDHSCPMDLSSQQQTPGVSNGVHDIVGAWDPEPGFSFTDLLTDEDSTTHEFLRAFPLSQELNSLNVSGGQAPALELAFGHEPKTASWPAST
ncbi:unnamed protein product [Schistocephalus solidus]|uniref:Zinc finger protein n=1 Tax=Schistocephalus solidus TaxID=70667 RepID=A0A183SM11_SCHSO|nr:unnamed protein product [Schistocephalus solidus]